MIEYISNTVHFMFSRWKISYIDRDTHVQVRNIVDLFLGVSQFFFKKSVRHAKYYTPWILAAPVNPVHTRLHIHSTADTRWLLDLVQPLQEIVRNALMSFYRITEFPPRTVLQWLHSKKEYPARAKPTYPGWATAITRSTITGQTLAAGGLAQPVIRCCLSCSLGLYNPKTISGGVLIFSIFVVNKI